MKDERRKSKDEERKSKVERQETHDHRTGTAATVLAVLVLSAGAALAQPATQNVEVEPVTCWWRAGVATVRVGEPFSVILTCSALETEAARAVIDRTRLGSAAVQFPPYEVTGGSQSEDHVTAGRRFMQYEYIVRLISEDAFGLDVPIKGMEITYRIESQVQQDAAVQGREQSYALPAIPMRVSSLVADNATHIREMTVPSLGEIAAREFRARMYRLLALILFGVAALTLAVALVRWARSRRTPTEVADTRLLSHRTVLGGVRRELRDLQQATRGAGWTPELVARALAAARVVASYMTGQPVPQRVSAQQATNGEVVLRGTLGRRNIAVSGAATAQGLTSARHTTSDIAASDLDTALLQLTTARYGRAAPESGDLDAAVATVIRAADRVAKRFTRVAETMGSVRQSARGWRPQAWVR
ncbi:MAG TPA: hypothetical protein VNJ02_07550 [Vicinamibacterales bacterium]|nr:hypothetical protein [Vicinamibacterales bacterium]